MVKEINLWTNETHSILIGYMPKRDLIKSDAEQYVVEEI